MTQQEALLNRLETELRAALLDIRTRFAPLGPEALRRRPAPDQWNALECLAHLNQYAEDYIPGINRAIHRAKARRWAPGDPVRYTARGRRLLRRADPALAKRFKTAKRYNFAHRPVEQEVIKSLIIKGEQLLRILQTAREVDLNRPNIEKIDAWFGRYTLGNLLEFIVLHQRRHLQQAAALVEKES